MPTIPGAENHAVDEERNKGIHDGNLSLNKPVIGWMSAWRNALAFRCCCCLSQRIAGRHQPPSPLPGLSRGDLSRPSFLARVSERWRGNGGRARPSARRLWRTSLYDGEPAQIRPEWGHRVALRRGPMGRATLQVTALLRLPRHPLAGQRAARNSWPTSLTSRRRP